MQPGKHGQPKQHLTLTDTSWPTCSAPTHRRWTGLFLLRGLNTTSCLRMSSEGMGGAAFACTRPPKLAAMLRGCGSRCRHLLAQGRPECLGRGRAERADQMQHAGAQLGCSSTAMAQGWLRGMQGGSQQESSAGKLCHQGWSLTPSSCALAAAPPCLCRQQLGPEGSGTA